MATTHHISPASAAVRVTAVALAAAALVAVLPAPASAYGWPVKPFHQQHPVRGLFGDPRIGHGGTVRQFHFGVDVSAPNGTPIYATLTGQVSLLHADVVVIHGSGGVEFSYWHIVPSVRTGTFARAYRTVIGHVEAPWAHVHFSEARYGRYVNPLRPGAMGPYVDEGAPVVRALQVESGGAVVPGTIHGTVDLIVEAYDRTPLLVPAPWGNLPVTPALIRWRLVAGERPSSRWNVAADFRETIPSAGAFGEVYAKWTRQNHAKQPGRYRVYLAHGWRSVNLDDGRYALEIAATDIRGNTGLARFPLVVSNHGTKAFRR